MKKLLLAAAVTAALLGLAGTPQSQDKKTLAFVVNGASDFWKAGRGRRQEGAVRTAELRPSSSNIPSSRRPRSRPA